MVRTQAEIVSATPAQRTCRGWRSAPTPTTADVTTVEVLTGAPTAVAPRMTAAADACEARESTGVGRKYPRPTRRTTRPPPTTVPSANTSATDQRTEGGISKVSMAPVASSVVAATPIAFCPSFVPSESATAPAETQIPPRTGPSMRLVPRESARTATRRDAHPAVRGASREAEPGSDGDERDRREAARCVHRGDLVVRHRHESRDRECHG